MNTPAPPSGPDRSRRGWRWLGYAGLALLILIGAATLFRQEIAGAAARNYLERQGIAVGSLRVSTLTGNSVVLDDLLLGTADEVSASHIHISFAVQSLSIRPKRIAVQDLRLRLDLTGEGPMLGSLQPLVDAQTAGTEDGPSDALTFDSLPALELSDAKVVALTGAGPMAIDIDGQLGPEAGGDLAGRVSASAAAEQGRLSAAIDARLSPAGAVAVEARIDEGQIDWRDIAVASLTGSFDLAIAADGAPRITADLNLVDLNYRPADAPALNLAEGKMTARGDLSDFTLRAALDGPGESLLLDAKGGINTEGAVGKLTLSSEAELKTLGALAAYLPLAGETVTKGSATLVANATADLPPGRSRPRRWQDFPALLQASAADLTGELILAEVALDEGSSGISAHLPLTAKLRDDGIEIRLSDDSELRIEAPSRRNLQDLGVPGDVLPLLTSGLSVSVAAQPFRLTLQPAWHPKDAEIAAVTNLTSEQGVSASLALEGAAKLGPAGVLAGLSGRLTVDTTLERFRLGDREARGVSAKLPLDFALGSKGLSLTLAGKGSARLRQLSGDLPLRLNKPLNLVIDQASLEQEDAASRYRYRLRSRTTSVDARLEPAAGDALDLGFGQTAITLGGSFDHADGHSAEVKAEVADISIPAYGLSIETTTASTRLDRDLRPVESRFTAKPVTLDTETTRLAPLVIDGTLRRRGAGYDIEATTRLFNGDLKLVSVDLRYDDTGSAEAKFRVEPLRFEPGGFQPSDIAPLLAVLEDVEGEISGDALVPWPLDAAAERGTLNLRGLSFGLEGIAVQGLSLDLGLQSLQPFSSEADQRLTIQQIAAGAPIDDVVLLFSLGQEPSPHLAITGGGFGLGGADWQLEPTKLDPAAVRNSVVLATDNLDLATFFRLIEIEGLSGNGVLAGRIPVVFEDNALVIAEGALTAQGPGSLSIRSQALASALAGGGKTVELAIKALEDFRYEALSVKLNKTAGNEAQVLLSILGSNPDVLNGQPFQFNINLESNLTSVLEALRQGYSLSDEALRRAWRLR